MPLMAGFHDFRGVHLVHVVVDDPFVDLAQDLEVVVELAAAAVAGIVPGQRQRGHQHRQQHQQQDQDTRHGDAESVVPDVCVFRLRHASYPSLTCRNVSG